MMPNDNFPKKLFPFPSSSLVAICCAALSVVGSPADARGQGIPVSQFTANSVSSGEPTARPAVLPQAFASALARAKVPLDAASVWVQEASGQEPARLDYRAAEPVNPASVMKLVSTYAALDLLGPAYVWRTRVYVDGAVSGGTLRGNVYLQGGGDPKLVMERLWLLLRQVQQRGVKVVLGDIVLDHGAYSLPPHDPGEFDGEPLRPYNAAPDALLINFKSVVLQFVPDPASGMAHVLSSPPMSNMNLPASVPLANGQTCPANWRDGLRLNIDQPGQWQLQGSYPGGCGERYWPVAYPDPQAYAAKVVEGMWRGLGGSLTGTVRAGAVPDGLRPLVTEPSASLAEIVRDVNKYSNNVMADHVFLAIGTGRSPAGVASYERSRDAVRQWWQESIGNPAGSLVLDNGSGLSRTSRVTAQALGRMLSHAWRSAVMPELLASLPAAGVDGTLRRSNAQGAAHLKTGSLRDVNAIAGYVHASSGKRYALVAIINHANAAAARGPAFDALIDWVAADDGR